MSPPFFLPFIPFLIIIFLIFGGVTIFIHMNNQSEAGSKKNLLKSFYFYLVSFVALMMFIFSASGFINTLTRVLVYPEASRYGFTGEFPLGPECQPPLLNTNTFASCEKRREDLKNDQTRQQRAQNYSDITNNLTFLVISIPLFIIHFRAARKQDKTE